MRTGLPFRYRTGRYSNVVGRGAGLQALAARGYGRRNSMTTRMRYVPRRFLIASAALALLLAPPPVDARSTRGKRTVPRVEKLAWGLVDGARADLYVLTNKNGLVAKVTNFGARLTEMHVPDRKGRLGDIVLGFDSVADYQKNGQYYGATVGRVANRIAGAVFELDGKTHHLTVNEPPGHLHGGFRGWSAVLWDAEPKDTPEGPAVDLTYLSKDGEEGYPGNVRAKVTYTLTNTNELRIEMEATSDAPTPVNMTHHSFWNLRGSLGGDIREHVLTVYAGAYTPGFPPDGKVLPVAGTPLDFTAPKPVGRDLAGADTLIPGAPAGYDHHFLIDGAPDRLRPVARVEEPRTGRVMTVDANQPGMQLYSSLWSDGSLRGKGRPHLRYGSLCFETHQPPNAVNLPAWREQVILRPGHTYRHVMVHKFSTK